MTQNEFEKIQSAFQQADTDMKIEMYINTEGLSQQQYKELLRSFPLSELSRLEKALDAE